MTDSEHVSTGQLPGGEAVRRLVDEAFHRFRDVGDGQVSTVYPALAKAEPGQFGICIAGVNGALFEAGANDVSFPIMSVAKPFAFALLCDVMGADDATEHIGADATGLPFDSVEAIERHDGRTNPMVNPGAIATVGAIAARVDEPWAFLHEHLSAFAGRELPVDEDTYRSATSTNVRNRAIAHLLSNHGALDGDPLLALDLYTRMCSLAVTARDLALMGATLADGGVHPTTGDAVASAPACRQTLVAMVTAGLYETSGQWLSRIGLPGKSGIGGGIVTVSPGKGGMGTFAPPLDPAGNSVRGQLAAAFLSARLGLDIFASTPHR